MNKKASVALGFFDGVHLAHQKIIRTAVEIAGKKGLAPLALTFDRPPAEVLFGKAVPLLTDNADKKALIAELGADTAFLPAEKSLLAKSGESVVREILHGKMNAGVLVCGYNYHFGSDRLGSVELCRLAEKLGMETVVVPELDMGGEAVSSSRIRTLLSSGGVGEAAALLGRAYSIEGEVEHGKKLGRAMGFPTLNICPSPMLAALKRGVYASRVFLGGEEYRGVTNVGLNPTVGGGEIRMETHIPGFSGEVYGQRVRVELLRFVREEKRFASVEELFAQIAEDIRNVMNLFEE